MKKAQNMPYQSRTLGAEAWYRFKKNKLALGALAIFILLALMAITTIIIDLVTNNSIYDKYVISQDLLQRLQPPSKEHILGMDEFGRDILLRIIWGTRYSLFMGAFAVLGASVLGGIIGAVAGYYNMMDTILMRIMDVFLAIPTTLLAVAIVAAMGPSLVNVVLAIAISQTPTFARVIRAQVLTIKDQEFIEAARSAGASDARIIFRYIVPNALSPMIVQVTMGMASAILSIAGLADETQCFALAKRQGQTIERVDASAVGVILNDKVFYFQNVAHSRPPSSSYADQAHHADRRR